MTQYMLMVLEDEAAHEAATPREMASLLERQASYAEALRKKGTLRDAGRLHASKEGRRVRRDARGAHVERGPFEGEARALGSFYWIEADNEEEAARVAAECPTLASDEIDVRPIMKSTLDPTKLDKPGKIFAFAVLGNAPNEEAWVATMDRIDGSSRDCFPETRAGGVRLMPPTTGRRVATDGGKRAMFDGPFLESKEVIGGIFFIRMVDIEEAVRWASGAPFVVHGALEIRELWRS